MRYEDLRRTALEGAWSTRWGLTLFLRQGLSAWMHAWPQEVGTDPPVPQPALPRVSRPAVSTSSCPQLVTVLANMILTARQEVLV